MSTMTCLAPAPTLGSREFVEEFDARHVVVRVLERALAILQREIELIGFRDLPGLAKADVRHPGDRAPLWREVFGR